MSEKKKETAQQRRARLAKALRANLRRRKAQARDRSAGAPHDDAGEGAEDDRD